MKLLCKDNTKKTTQGNFGSLILVYMVFSEENGNFRKVFLEFPRKETETLAFPIGLLRATCFPEILSRKDVVFNCQFYPWIDKVCFLLVSLIAQNEITG